MAIWSVEPGKAALGLACVRSCKEPPAWSCSRLGCDSLSSRGRAGVKQVFWPLCAWQKARWFGFHIFGVRESPGVHQDGQCRVIPNAHTQNSFFVGFSFPSPGLPPLSSSIWLSVCDVCNIELVKTIRKISIASALGDPGDTVSAQQAVCH